MRHLLRNVFSLGLSLFLLMAGVTAYAAGAPDDARIVRVGYFDLGSYYTARADGTVSSYDASFLNEIARYTGYAFTYVDCKTWDQAIAMLENHEIDLVGTMQWTAEREQKYAICDASYGYSVAELAALESSSYVYQDYAAIADATIGYIGGYVIENQLQAFFRENGISPDLRIYETQTQLDQALMCGEIDLVAANAHAVHKDWKVVDKFAYSPFYFASWKGNEEVTDSISEAIIEIHVYEANFADSLMKSYFPQLVSAPFSKEELDCISSSAPFSIYFDANVAPLAWYDEESAAMQGVLIEVCRQLSQQTGLQLDILPGNDSSASEKATSVSYRTLYYSFGKDASEEPGVTDSILDQDFEMYHKLGRSYADGEAVPIAIVVNRDGLKDYLSEMYPNCTVVECKTPAECIRLVEDGQAGLAFLNTNVADRIFISENIDEITALPMSRVTFGIALQFHGEDAELLAGIVDKGIQLLDQSKITETLLGYALNTARPVSLLYLVQQHLPLTIAICVLLVLILCALAILFTYAMVMRRQRIRVEQANQARTDFFSRMSHDMRTPMNGILGMIALTKQARTMDEVQANMDKAESAGNYMLNLINDTLDLQRLESGKLKFNLQTVEAAAFFENLLEMARSSAEQKALTYYTEQIGIKPNIYLQLDPVRVRQVISNLTSNAIKFTCSGGEVRVSVQRLSGDGQDELYQFCVQDTGVGMSREYIEKNLYQAYAQEHNIVSDQYAGSGLGLAITKNLVELMDGRILVESEPGEGTAFTVRIPFQQVDSAEAASGIQNRQAQADQLKSGLKGKRVLLAEDHPLNAEIVMRLLKKAECDTVWMPDGQQTVDCFEHSAPGEFDAILMDIRMPVMNGLEAAKAVRALQRPDAGKIPILALSANAYDEDVKACLAAGMNAHLAKPIDPAALYAVLLGLI